ncbi:MAG: DUF4230 domain-containing protein [Leptolyngbyaceae cyanobacterium SL_7_1]|nr:DUF4230 domain-containing protein [Leptolyngbyaceae cyanobacterium SL_7_1]
MSSYSYRDRHTASRTKERKPGRQPLQQVMRNISLMLTGGIVLAGAFVGYGVWRSGNQFLSGVRDIFTAEQPEPQVDVQSIVLQQVRGASELTTAVFAMQAVVPASRDRTVAGYTVGKTTLLYIAYGEVRAGVDLSKLTPENVNVVGDTVYLQLPPPQILDSKIDVTRSTVYDYDRGFLGLGPDAAPELQSLAERQTLEEIVQTACNQGLLQEASDRAKVTVTQLLGTAGHNNFSVEVQPALATTCGIPADAAVGSPPSSFVPASPSTF